MYLYATGDIRHGHLWFPKPRGITTPWQLENYYRHLHGDMLALFRNVCRNLPTVREFLHSNPEVFPFTQELLAAGREYSPPTASRTPVDYDDLYWMPFNAAFAHAKEVGGRYVEGIAINPHGVYIHAWVSTNDMDVDDRLWSRPDLNHYFGFEMTPKEMEEYRISPGSFELWQIAYARKQPVVGHA